MPAIRCFMLERNGKARRFLRRYSEGRENACPLRPGKYSSHIGEVILDDIPHEGAFSPTSGDLWPHDDPRWPTHCACGYEFQESDEWQLSCHNLYRRQDTGEEMTLHSLPPGAMYWADWLLDEGSNRYRGPDGKSLAVMTPGGLWLIDSEASNCTRKGDDSHRCWIRHGTPPDITVDKNGETCAAGAGSIAAGSYHGFLRNGELVDA